MRSSLINLSLTYALTRLKGFPFPAQARRERHENEWRPAVAEIGAMESPLVNTSPADGFVFVSDPEGEAAHRYRDIVDEILARTWPRKLMMVTSSTSGEGKTLTSVNLALALAEKRHSVLLIELTLMRPRYRYVFGEPPTSSGVESVLSGESDPEEITFALADTGVAVASVAHPLRNYDLLNQQARLQRLLAFGDARFDWTVLDVPSMDECRAVKSMAAEAGPVVMVARSHRTKVETFRRATHTLGNDLDYVILNDLAS